MGTNRYSFLGVEISIARTISRRGSSMGIPACSRLKWCQFGEGARSSGYSTLASPWGSWSTRETPHAFLRLGIPQPGDALGWRPGGHRSEAMLPRLRGLWSREYKQGEEGGCSFPPLPVSERRNNRTMLPMPSLNQGVPGLGKIWGGSNSSTPP